MGYTWQIMTIPRKQMFNCGNMQTNDKLAQKRKIITILRLQYKETIVTSGQQRHNFYNTQVTNA